MRDMTLWLLLANTLVVAVVAYRGMVRASLVPVRISARLAPFERHRSR